MENRHASDADHELHSTRARRDQARSAAGNAVQMLVFDQYGGPKGYMEHADDIDANAGVVMDSLRTIDTPPESPSPPIGEFVGDKAIQMSLVQAVKLYNAAIAGGFSAAQLQEFADRQAANEERVLTPAEQRALHRYKEVWDREEGQHERRVPHE